MEIKGIHLWRWPLEDLTPDVTYLYTPIYQQPKIEKSKINITDIK